MIIITIHRALATAGGDAVRMLVLDEPLQILRGPVGRAAVVQEGGGVGVEDDAVPGGGGVFGDVAGGVGVDGSVAVDEPGLIAEAQEGGQVDVDLYCGTVAVLAFW